MSVKKVWLPVLGALLFLGAWWARRETPSGAPIPPRAPAGAGTPVISIPAGPVAKGGPPAPPRPAPAASASVSVELSKALDRYRAKEKILHPSPPPRFERERALRLREARLLGLAHPDECVPLLAAMAENPKNDVVESAFAMTVLGLLSQAGIDSARAVLSHLIRDGSADVSSFAIMEASVGDPKGLFRPLYLDRSSQGSFEAIEALSAWGDAETIAYLETLLKSPRQDAAWEQALIEIRQSLDRCRLLQSPEAEATFTRILSEPTFPEASQTPWALAAAQLRSWPALQQTLKARLAKDLEKVMAHGPRAAEAYVRDGRPAGLDDYYHDDLLVAYASMGGSLTEFQEKRLRCFGYGVDPATRLTEFLASPDDSGD